MMFIVQSQPFEWVIILTILSNCTVMAMDDKLSNNDKTILAIKLVRIIITFTLIITFNKLAM